jgi:hypothetical protein
VSVAEAIRQPAVPDERLHKIAVLLLAVVLGTVIAAVLFYGFDYYRLSPARRVYDPKHAYLRPSGRIGLKLGIAGLICFFGVYLYAVRKRVKRMSRLGKTRNWLDFHIVLGVAAPLFITLHSSFKMQGLAGIAYWIMIAVMLSGIVGRYLYAQIPRSITAAELSIQDMRTLTEALTAELREQDLLTVEDLGPLLATPEREQVEQMPILAALFLMFRYDVARPFHLARVRRRFMSLAEKTITFGGLFHSRQDRLEQAIDLVRRRSWIATKISFLSKTQEIFHLWHVVHRPFSYSFAVLAGVHIVVVVLMGYFF